MSTHQQLLYHIVFSTKRRRPWLTEDIREPLFAYMAGTCRELGGFAIRVGGFIEHVHLLVRIPAKLTLSDYVGKVKSATSKHINETSGKIAKFSWQNGYGAFSVSYSQKDKVIAYIDRQVEHHSKLSFDNEYRMMLDCHEVEYDPQYILD